MLRLRDCSHRSILGHKRGRWSPRFAGLHEPRPFSTERGVRRGGRRSFSVDLLGFGDLECPPSGTAPSLGLTSEGRDRSRRRFTLSLRLTLPKPSCSSEPGNYWLITTVGLMKKQNQVKGSNQNTDVRSRSTAGARTRLQQTLLAHGAGAHGSWDLRLMPGGEGGRKAARAVEMPLPGQELLCAPAVRASRGCCQHPSGEKPTKWKKGRGNVVSN